MRHESLIPDRVRRLEVEVQRLTTELSAYAKLFKTLEAKREEYLRATVRPKGPTPVPSGVKMSTICDAVAKEFDVTVEEIKGRSRVAHLNEARQEAMRLMWDAGHSLPKIGRFLGGRDHTTIMAGIRKARARIAQGGAE